MSLFGVVVNSSELAPTVLAAQEGAVGSDGAGRANPAVVFEPVRPPLLTQRHLWSEAVQDKEKYKTA